MDRRRGSWCNSRRQGASWRPCWGSRWPVERSSHAERSGGRARCIRSVLCRTVTGRCRRPAPSRSSDGRSCRSDGSLIVDFLAQTVGVGKQSLVAALGDEAIEAGVLGEDVGFFLEGVADRELVLRRRRRESLRAFGLDACRVEGVLLAVPILFVHPDRRLDQLADRSSQ